MLCPHHCRLAQGQVGYCQTRRNEGGRIISLSYGKITALALDPIEKKPFARFHAGSRILSVGSFGCNMRCPFCQNSDISMADATIHAETMSPEQLVEKAKALIPHGNIGIAYTYNEPLINFEYVLASAALAREAGLINALVTNGMICPAPLTQLLPYVDAMNIDLKCFTEEGYVRLGGNLAAVKHTIRTAAKACHVEVTTLIVPGLSDAQADMQAQAAWLRSIDPAIPLHITRFYPRHQMQGISPTDVSVLKRLRDIAAQYLQHVYLGNC